MTVFRSLLAAAAIVWVTAAAFAQRIEIANAAQPQLTVDSDGRVWLVFGRLGEAPPSPAHEHGQKHKGHHQPSGRAGDVFVASSTDGGATFSPAVRVAHVPQLMLGN